MFFLSLQKAILSFGTLVGAKLGLTLPLGAFSELFANRFELPAARRLEERGVSARSAREARRQRPDGPQGRNPDRPQ